MKKRKMKRLAKQLTNICTVSDMCILLKCSVAEILELHERPKYNTFKIPKKNGEFRVIEAPGRKLKKIQRRLNKYLSAYYYQTRSSISYGFVKVPDDSDTRLDIVENAKQHLGKDYLWNVDIDAFFHSIKRPQIKKIWFSVLGTADGNTIDILTNLTSYKGRLPMGAPSSPILSNIYCKSLDNELKAYADRNHLTITRYVDDISVSSNGPISSLFEPITNIIQTFGFQLNADKKAYYKPEHEKIVTGLYLRESKVEPSPEFIEEIHLEIKKLDYTVESFYRFGYPYPKWIKKLEQRIESMISFVEYVDPKDVIEIQTMENKLNAVFDKPQSIYAMDWFEFPYMNFSKK